MIRDVIVIGGNHHNTLGVIRSLGYEGIKPILVLIAGDNEDTYIDKSCYIKRCIRVSHDNEVKKVLSEVSCQANKKSVIIACTDGVASVIDLNRADLSASFCLPGCEESGLVTQMMDKDRLTNYAKSIGLNVPVSWVVEHEEDIHDITYPCITKPILSKDGCKGDIKVCYSEEDLINLLKNGSCYKYQVQEFLEKEFEYQLIGLSLEGGGGYYYPWNFEMYSSSSRYQYWIPEISRNGYYGCANGKM